MVCAFTGYRPEKFSFGYQEDHPDCIRLKALLRREIEALIHQGFDRFLCGMAMGTDLWCAEAVLSLRTPEHPVMLEAILPHPEQTRAWSRDWQLRHRRVLEAADRQVTVSPRYTRGCMAARNRYLVDHADLILAVFSGKPGGTAGTIEYAARLGRDLLLVQPEVFHVLRLTKDAPPEQTSLPL